MFDRTLNLFSCRFMLLARDRCALVTLSLFPLVIGVVMSLLSGDDGRAKLLGLLVLLPVSGLMIAAFTSDEGLVPRMSAMKGLSAASNLAEVLFGSAVLAVQAVVYTLVVLLIGAGSAPGLGAIIAAWCISSAIHFGAIHLVKTA